MDLPNNPDILHRILEFLGPRSTCLTIGSTNNTLRQLSQCDSLWRIFWMRRCCLTDDQKYYTDERSIIGFGNDDDGLVVHRAALTFRHAIHSLNLSSKLFAATHPPPPQQQQQLLQEEGDDEIDNDNDDTTTTAAAASPSLYAGYIQTHSMMKLTNLRPVKLITNGDDGHHEENEVQQQHYQLRQQLCTQTWPGQLSLLNERLLQRPPHVAANNTNNNNAVTCLNSAEIWCDHPTCNQARCGPQGCLRCYRFLPPPPVQYLHQQQQQQQQRRDNNRLTGDLDGPGDILGSWRRYRECTDRHYDLISFVKCDWCSVSFCNEHIDTVYNDGSTNTNNEERRRRGGEAVAGGGQGQQAVVWYKCDECNLSSCPQCISQVLLIQPPQMCHVITAGKKCGRQICSSCIWAVGKEGPMNDDTKDDCVSNIIPGGKISEDDLEVVSIRARDEEGRRRMERFQEKEMCCSKCLRHVEFRWRELSVVLNMFDGFVP